MRVALLQCPVWGTREPPLALVQLSSCLKSKGHEAKCFDLNNHLYRHRQENFKNLWAWEQSQFWYNRESVAGFFNDISPVIDSFVESVLSYAPGAIGFSVAASSYPASVEIARRLKTANPSIRVVFGGQTFYDRRYIERTFNDAPVDFILLEDGDIALPELVSLLESNESMEKCAGICYRREGSFGETAARRQLSDMDSLPFMDYSDLKLEDYDDTVHISLMSSRGCVWQCAFCSSRSFWKGYRYMNGERIHQEIAFHRTTQKVGMSHVDFADLCFNGNMDRVKEFCDLMIKYPPYPRSYPMQWNANAIIHPGLTPDVLAAMKKAGCQRLFFGIESGSQKVLKLMRKKYDVTVARRVLRDAHDAGIKVTANFMFGFPGETDEDFEETLNLLRDIGGYLDRAYPSRTYCAIEEFSYFHEHPDEFNIRTPFSHHLYWETKDGLNTYPVRLKRCQRFEELCSRNGITTDCGVRTAVELDEWFNLGHYYEYQKDFAKAAEYFMRYLGQDRSNEIIVNRLRAIYRDHEGSLTETLKTTLGNTIRS